MMMKMIQSAFEKPPVSFLRKMSAKHDDQQPDPDHEREEQEHVVEHVRERVVSEHRAS